MEVKATTALDGNFVQISNLDQLDPTGVTVLHLIVCALRYDPASRTLDERIRQLISDGFPQDLLIDKVGSAGYVFESAIDIDTRYAVRSVRIWHVADAFPGLRRNDLGEARLKGVSKVKYGLALDAAPPRLTDSAASTLFEGWVLGL